jgi:hypothetical protein
MNLRVYPEPQRVPHPSRLLRRVGSSDPTLRCSSPSPCSLCFFSVHSVLKRSLQLVPESAYNTIMRISALIYLSRAIASLLALCLLITPLCSARCALAACLPASAPTHSAGGCHHSSAKSHAATSLAAVAPASCQSADSLFDALPTRQTLSPKTRTSPVVQLFFAASSTSDDGISNHSSEFARLAPDSSPDPHSSLNPLRL